MTNEHFKNKYLKYKNKYYDLVNKKYSLKNNRHKIAGGTALEIAGGLTGILLIIAIIMYSIYYNKEKFEPTLPANEIIPSNILRKTETVTPAAEGEAEQKKAEEEARKEAEEVARREAEEKARREAEAALGLAVALSQK